MLFANKYGIGHIATDACAMGSFVCEYLASLQTAGVTLPWHITAAVLVATMGILGKITKSLTEPAASPVVLAVQGSVQT